jgi:hypothetical protein
MNWRFTQGAAPLAPLDCSECHLLTSLEGPPAHARLASASSELDSGLDYALELLTDTGPVPEPYGALMLVAFDIPPHMRAEVDRWYEEEHVGLLMRADGWLRARRFGVTSHNGKSWTSLAFHELRDVTVLDSEERKVARSTPWRAELERDAWFQQAGRWVFARG